MKKRIFSFLLCLLMLLPLVLTSCGSNQGDVTTPEGGEVYKKPATLNFYIISNKMTADAREAQALMQEAFNNYARMTYNTEVHFVFCTAAEYEAKVTADLAAAAELGGTSPSEKFEAAEVETELDAWGGEIEVYPDIYDNQVDILLITSKDMYNSLKNSYLADLTETLALFPEITQRVNSNLINGAKDNGKMYGIPNNVLIGKYKYVLVHKDMALKYQYINDASAFYTDGTKLLDYDKLRSFAQAIHSSKDAGASTYQEYQELKAALGVSEIFPMETAFEYPTVTFFPKAGEDTLFGVVYDYDTTYMNPVSLTNVISKDSPYTRHMALMLEAENKGYYPNPNLPMTEDAAYAIKYVEGSYLDREKYDDDYFIFEIDRPRVEDDGAFDAMFAVSKYTASVSRSMEIIEALVADEDAVLRNILQYGVEGKHFEVVKDDLTGIDYVVRTQLGKSYDMNVNYTGNVITALPCPEDGRGIAYAEYFKNQNESAKRNPLYGLTARKLWDDAQNAMVKTARCIEMRDAITAEINALTNASLLYSKKAELISGIPTEDDVLALRTYWGLIRDDLDPLLEENTSDMISKETDAQLTADLTAIRNEVTADVVDFLETSADVANYYMELALACTTVEELDEICEKLESLYSATTKDNADPYENGKYFYSAGNSAWGNGYVGMLVATANSLPSDSLAGALQIWWSGLK